MKTVSQAITKLLKDAPPAFKEETAERLALAPLKCSQCGNDLYTSPSSAGYTILCIKVGCIKWHTVAGVLVSWKAANKAEEKEMRFKY